MATKKTKEAEVVLEPMPAEMVEALVETSPSETLEAPEEVQETQESIPETAQQMYGVLQMPRDLLMGAQRFSTEPHVVETETVLYIPEGCVGIISLSNRLATRTRIRLAGNSLLFPEDSGKPVKVVLENLGTDSFFLTRGSEVARFVVLK